MQNHMTQASIEKHTTAHALQRNPWIKFLLVLALSFCSYLFFSRVVVTAVEVRGSSMSPTLRPGDRVMLNRLAILHRAPQRGELVVLKDPQNGELVVKRVIGLPEEMVQMGVDLAFINGQRLSEPYLMLSDKAPLGTLSAPVRLPSNHYFVLGDNRHNSIDSREFGPVPRENILGVISL